jgi:hypothetical protein
MATITELVARGRALLTHPGIGGEVEKCCERDGLAEQAWWQLKRGLTELIRPARGQAARGRRAAQQHALNQKGASDRTCLYLSLQRRSPPDMTMGTQRPLTLSTLPRSGGASFRRRRNLPTARAFPRY